MATAIAAGMTKDDQLPEISLDQLANITGGAGLDPSMTAKGDAISFGATGCNGPANGAYGGGSEGGTRMTWQ